MPHNRYYVNLLSVEKPKKFKANFINKGGFNVKKNKRFYTDRVTHRFPEKEVNTMAILITIFSSLLSGIVAVIISKIYYRNYEKHKIKVDTLTRFVGNRYDLKGDKFSGALNEIFVVFQSSSDVMSTLSKYHEKVVARQNSEDNLIRLFKAMCDDVGVKYDQFNDSFFTRPFNTR